MFKTITTEELVTATGGAAAGSDVGATAAAAGRLFPTPPTFPPSPWPRPSPSPFPWPSPSPRPAPDPWPAPRPFPTIS